MKRSFVFLVMFLFCLSASFAWKAGFAHCKSITIPNTNVDADLANFSVYVPIVNDTGLMDGCQADLDDIIFTTTNDADLYFELLPGYNQSTGNADYYVLVNPVDHDANTVIYCYYENPSATKSSYNDPTKVFDTANGWVAVCHLEEASGTIYDATSNSVDSDATTGTPDYRQAGKVGYGIQYSDIEYHTFTDGWVEALTATVTSYTFELWYKQTGTCSNYRYWLDAQTAGKIGLKRHSSSTSFAVSENGEAYDATITTNIFDGAFHHLAFVSLAKIGETNGQRQAYIDGLPEGDSIIRYSTSFDVTGEDIYLPDNAGDIDGILDEVRISNTNRSAAWIKFGFYNSHDGHAVGNELTWGSEASPPSTYIPKVVIIR